MCIRDRYNGDPAFVDVPVEKLLSRESAEEIRKSIGDSGIRDFKPADHASLYQPAWPNHSTSHMVIIDEEGNSISATNTLGTFFGAGMVAGGTGMAVSYTHLDVYKRQPQLFEKLGPPETLFARIVAVLPVPPIVDGLDEFQSFTFGKRAGTSPQIFPLRL